MRIKLTESLPVDPKYNMVRGRILEVFEDHKRYGRGYIRWTVKSDCGERIGVFQREAVVMPDSEETERN